MGAGLSAGTSPITRPSVPARPFAAALAISIVVLAAFPYANASPLHFQNCQAQTGRNASVLLKKWSPFYLISANGHTESLAPGDEVAAFTPEGLCAGSLVWKGQTVMLSLWEDDPLTPAKDGFAPGDPLALRVWDASNGSLLVSLFLRYQAPLDTTGHYGTDSIYNLAFAFVGPPPSLGARRRRRKSSQTSCSRRTSPSPPPTPTRSARLPPFATGSPRRPPSG